jgi:hypothetical protein
MLFKRLFKVLFIVIVAFVFATVATAYAAANTVPSSNAGDGSGTITGYVVSNIHYTLNSVNPSQVDSVAFTVAPAVTGGTVEVMLNGTTWNGCTIGGGGTSITCNVTGISALSAANLRVVAAQ